MKVVRRILKFALIALAVLVVILAGIISYASFRWNAKVDRKVPELVAKRDSITVARGEFLYKSSIGCWTCHGGEKATANTPPMGGLKFDLSTLSPSLGVYYAANITPDAETGIGNWTDGEIVRAMRDGIRKDGTALFPIMPNDPLHGLSDDDALAIVAYLRNIPPVKHVVPEKSPSLFAKVLFTLGAIGPMPEQSAPVVAPKRAITPEYGEYVARHASLCSDCHTPRNLMNGEFYYDSLLAGSSFKFGDEDLSPVRSFARNITPDNETGIGRWTEEQFMTMLRTGVGPDGKVRSKHMPYAYYGLWDTLELKAVYRFIRTLKPVHRTTPPSEFVLDRLSDDPVTKGRGIFNSTCVSCHGDAGKGALPTRVVLAEVAPSLTDAELIEFVEKGNPELRMPGFEKTLDRNEFKALVAYIRSWKKSIAGTN